MGQHRLGQDLGRLGAAQHGLHPGEREAVLGPEGEDHGVVVRRGLQLEVERDAEPLAQRQAQRPVDAATEGRVDDQLRPLAVVEAALDDESLPGREVPQRRQAGGAVGDDLLGDLGGHPGAGLHQLARTVAIAGGQQRFERGAQLTHRLGELGRAGRCLTQPEGNGRRQVPGVVDADRAHLHLGHPPRMRAQKEDVSRCRLHGEVLVHRSNRHPVGVEHHAVVAGLGDGAPAGQRGQPGAPPGPKPAVDGVEVQVRAAAPAPGLDPPARQRHDVVEVTAGQLCIGGCMPGHGPHRLDVALVGGGHLRHQLLGQDVERGDRWLEQIQPALAHGGEQRGALDELVPRRRVETARRSSVAVVVRPAHALEEGADGAWRPDLADELDRSDVDPEFERCRGHQRAQVARPQAGLDDAPPRRREAPVVRGDEERGVDVGPARRLVLPEALGQLVRHPLRHLARVDEDQGGAVMAGVLRDAVEDVRHLAAAHDGLELGGGQLDGDLEVAGVAAVDDHRGRTVLVHTAEEPGDEIEGPLRRRQPDALEGAAVLGHECVESFEAERQVAAPLVAGERVHLVDDHGPHTPQQRPRRGRGQEEVEGLGGRDEQVR